MAVTLCKVYHTGKYSVKDSSIHISPALYVAKVAAEW